MVFEYKVGDLYLTHMFSDKSLKEVEIIDTCVNPPLIKTSSGWEKAEDFHKKVLCKLGHFQLKGLWILKRRVFVKE